MNKETLNTGEEKRLNLKESLGFIAQKITRLLITTGILFYFWNSKNFLSFFTRSEISFWEFLCIMAILDNLFHFFVSSFKARK